MNHELDALKQRLLEPFPAALVAVRTTPSVQAYCTARTVMDRLDEVLPFSWWFTLGEHWYDENKVLHQKGQLRLHIVIEEGQGWRECTYEDVGSAPPDPPRVQPKQAKQAVSDCIKRCGVQAGVGRYLYALRGVSPQSLPMAAVEKAARAVGWRGEINPDMFGPIGGKRELSFSDDDTEDALDESVMGVETIRRNGDGETDYVSEEEFGVMFGAELIPNEPEPQKPKNEPLYKVKDEGTGVPEPYEPSDDADTPPGIPALQVQRERDATRRIRPDAEPEEGRAEAVETWKAAAKGYFVMGSPKEFSNTLMVEVLRQEIPGLSMDRPIVPQLTVLEMRELTSCVDRGKSAFSKELQKARYDYRAVRKTAWQADLSTYEIGGHVTATVLKNWTKGIRDAVSAKLKTEADAIREKVQADAKKWGIVSVGPKQTGDSPSKAEKGDAVAVE